MTFAKRIRELRIERGLTQKELADRCGMADSAIRKYESGKVVPKYDNLFKIAEALGVDGVRIIFDDKGDFLFATQSEEDKAKEADVRREELFNVYGSLNEKGQTIALERLKELAKISDYCKKKK